MKTSEISSMIVASAEPKPIRCASPTMLLNDQGGDQLQPVAALVDDVDEVERAQRLDHGDDQDDDVDRPQHREDHPEERLRVSDAPSIAAASRSDGSTPFRPAR